MNRHVGTSSEIETNADIVVGENTDIDTDAVMLSCMRM